MKPAYSSTQIKDPLAFNLFNADDRPDLRSLRYKSCTDHLICPICHQPFIAPMTTACGHTFCGECIHECIKMQCCRQESDEGEDGTETLKGSCPLDRNPIDPSTDELFPTPIIVTNLVDELEVFCLNEKRGCTWTGKRWQAESHVLYDCGYTGVSCNGIRDDGSICRAMVERRLLEAEEEGPRNDKLDSYPKEISSEPDNEKEEEGEEEEEEEEGEGEEKEEVKEGEKEVEEEQEEGQQIHDIEENSTYEGVIADQIEQIEQMKLSSGASNRVEGSIDLANTVDSHQCIHRLTSCTLCDEEIYKLEEQQHLENDCPYNYTSCTICLNDLIPVKNIKQHEENCGKSGHLKCPAASVGCDWVGNNQTSLEIHLQNNNCQLNKLMPTIQMMNDRIEGLSKENRTLQSLINKILDSIIQGKITNLGYNEPLEEISKFSSEMHSQDKLYSLNCEVDRLKYELEGKVLPLLNRETSSRKEGETIINGLVSDNFMMKDDLNVQRLMINSLRKQLQFMVYTRKNGAGGFLPVFNSGNDMDVHDGFDGPSRSSSEERLNLKL